jgi:hypothetical protein
MLAVVYAAAHAETSAVVTIDGHSIGNGPFWRRLPRLQRERVMELRRLQGVHASRRFTGDHQLKFHKEDNNQAN